MFLQTPLLVMVVLHLTTSSPLIITSGEDTCSQGSGEVRRVVCTDNTSPSEWSLVKNLGFLIALVDISACKFVRIPVITTSVAVEGPIELRRVFGTSVVVKANR